MNLEKPNPIPPGATQNGLDLEGWVESASFQVDSLDSDLHCCPASRWFWGFVSRDLSKGEIWDPKKQKSPKNKAENT